MREALHERANPRANAPHLVAASPSSCHCTGWHEAPYYFAGLKAYDARAGKANFRRSAHLGRRATRELTPDLKANALAGSVRYFERQFDDARLALAVARTAIDNGATVLNYVRAIEFHYEGERPLALRGGRERLQTVSRARREPFRKRHRDGNPSAFFFNRIAETNAAAFA